MIIDRFSGMPTSPATSCAISIERACSPSVMRWRYLARSSREVSAQAGKAALAACTARSTSSAVPSGMRPITSSVPALITSMVPVPVDGTHAPSM
jgi:hypothetical protein